MRIELLPARILETCAALRARVVERFPGSSLARLAEQLERIAGDAAARAERIRRPRLLLRALVVLVLAAAAAVLAFAVAGLPLRFSVPDGWEAIQTAEAFISALVFLGAAAIFLVTMEGRSKRNETLGALEELRVLAHVVDMHQLTKDPDRVLGRGTRTPSSPTSALDAFGLSRYLDYCSEILALVGKVGVLYAQGLHDAAVLEAVDDIEDLTTGLSRKIWQKIVILDRYAPAPSSPPAVLGGGPDADA
jgi:hypothetical protein